MLFLLIFKKKCHPFNNWRNVVLNIKPLCIVKYFWLSKMLFKCFTKQHWTKPIYSFGSSVKAITATSSTLSTNSYPIGQSGTSVSISSGGRTKMVSACIVVSNHSPPHPPSQLFSMTAQAAHKLSSTRWISDLKWTWMEPWRWRDKWLCMMDTRGFLFTPGTPKAGSTQWLCVWSLTSLATTSTNTCTTPTRWTCSR